MTRRVLLFASGHVTLAAALTGLAWNDSIAAAGLYRTLALAGAFALVGSLPVHVELGRHATSVTLVDAVLVVGLFIVPDARAVALAAMGGELLACAISRQAPLKILFNAAAALGTVTLAARTFALHGQPDATQPLTWLVTLAAVIVYALSNHASTSAVLTVVEGRRFHDLFLEALVPAAAATAVSAGLGVTVVVLFAASPSAPVLLLPLGVVSYAAFRAVAAQRAESLRFKRLYESSARTSSVRGVGHTLTIVASEARSLVAGCVAIAAAPGEHGEWTAIMAGDSGAEVLDADSVTAIRSLAVDHAVEVPVTEIDPVLATLAPHARDVVIAVAAGDLQARLLVFRDIADERGEVRAGVLAAFAAHAALATANARLFDELEASLQAEIDLNRQKDEFLASVSHELRTPLTSVLGSVSTLRQHAGALDDTKRNVLYEIAERQAIKLKALIEDLLLVAAAESGAAGVNPEPVEIGPFLGNVAAGVTTAITVVTAPNAPRVVRTDPSRLRQLLEAVLDNAGKFAPGPVELLARPSEGGLAIAVRDHGPGIAEMDRTRVFERFVQLDQSSTRTHGGTGTGLYLCTKLADLLGGDVCFEETSGGGATFVLTLPGHLDRPDRVIACGTKKNDHDKRAVAAAAAVTSEDHL